MNILILDELSDSVIAQMQNIASVLALKSSEEKSRSSQEVIKLMVEYKPDIVIVDATPINAEIMGKAPWLKMVVCTRGNPVNVDSQYCREHGIMLSNTPGRNANSVAEFVIAMMINMLRNIPGAMERLKSGELCLPGHYENFIQKNRDSQDIIWRHDALAVIPYFEFMGGEIFGKCLGLVGLGIIGNLVAAKAAALGMNVVAYDPYFRGELAHNISLVSLETLAAQSDIISLHAKDTPETAGMINRSFFAKVRKGTWLVNTARGRLVNRNDLLCALDAGILAGAALDVYDYEPLAKDDPLMRNPGIYCTPHIAGASKDVVMQHSLMAYNSVNAFVSGAPIIPFRYV